MFLGTATKRGETKRPSAGKVSLSRMRLSIPRRLAPNWHPRGPAHFGWGSPMTSISSAGLAPSAFTSPRDLLQNELQSEVSSGAISADDQSALSSALDDIDSALKSERESDQASGAGRPTHEQMQSKINDLIANEVQNGTLTSDQADELKNVFAKAFSHGGDGAGGPGGPGGSSGQGGQG